MIDTIIIRINNLSQYPKIYDKYYNPDKDNFSFTKAFVDQETGEMSEEERGMKLNMIYHDRDRFLPILHVNKLNLPSSHYTIAIKIDVNQDFLEFNFSIPKKIFGTNVMQFINYYEQDCDTQYYMLIKFLADFQSEYLPEKVLPFDFEINRIDLCYNQFFNSKNDALEYLDHQKKLLVKYARSSKNNYRSYDTSLMYITARYSFKIYHKGTEFKKNDLGKILKLENIEDMPLQRIIDESENILRYEMTFRKSMLNYLHEQYFEVSKKQAESNYQSDYPLSRMLGQMAIIYPKLYENYKGRSKVIALSSEIDHTTDFEILSKSRNIKFDLQFWKIIHEAFWKKVSDYQLNPQLSIDEIKLRVDNWNNDIQLKNQFRRKKECGKDTSRLMILAILSQKLDNFSELKNYISESSFYRFKRELAKIGITTNDAKIDIPRPSLNYHDYKIIFKDYHNAKNI